MTGSCTINGVAVNYRNAFLPYLAQSNWRACNFAQQYGFQCADSFAQYMGADYVSNGDGQIDSDALAYIPGETEANYVNRITVTLKSTLRDSNTHFVNSTTSYDYIQSDDTHPTYTGSTVYIGLIGGSGSTTTAPDYSDASIVWTPTAWSSSSGCTGSTSRGTGGSFDTGPLAVQLVDESRKKRNGELFYRKQKSFSLAGLKHILIRAIERAGIGMDVKDREEFVERMGAPAYENPTAA